MAQTLDDVDFWLPPDFLTDYDFLMEKENTKNGLRSVFANDVSKWLFPYELPSGLSSFVSAHDLASPVGSLVSSTETESEEEDYISELTRQIAHSTLRDGFSGHNRPFPSDNTEGRCLSGSPQSTLCELGIGCGCRLRSAENCQPRVSSRAAAWDLYLAAAEEVARMRMNEDLYGFNHCRAPSRPPGKTSHVPVGAKNRNFGSAYYSNPSSLSYQKLQASQFQQLKQQQMMKQKQQELVKNRGRANNGHLPGLSPSAWPTTQHPQQQNHGARSGTRGVFLGNPAPKRECTGTGVFLPRRVNTTTMHDDTRKKPAVSAAVLPAKVVHALKPDSDPVFSLKNDAYIRLRNGDVYANQKRSVWPEPSATNELRLPQDWSY